MVTMPDGPDGPDEPAKHVTPEQMLAWAEMAAANLLSLPEAEKDSWLVECKKNSPVFHALVRHELTAVRSAAKKPKDTAPWLKRLMGDMGILPKPEDNLGWGI